MHAIHRRSHGAITTFAALLGLFTLPLAARAEPPPAEQTPAVYTFDDDAVFGRQTEPMGEVLVVRQRSPRTSLVRTRESFVRELLKSIEAL